MRTTLTVGTAARRPHPLGSTTVASNFWRSFFIRATTPRIGCSRTHGYLFLPRFAALIPLLAKEGEKETAGAVVVGVEGAVGTGGVE